MRIPFWRWVLRSKQRCKPHAKVLCRNILHLTWLYESYRYVLGTNERRHLDIHLLKNIYRHLNSALLFTADTDVCNNSHFLTQSFGGDILSKCGSAFAFIVKISKLLVCRQIYLQNHTALIYTSALWTLSFAEAFAGTDFNIFYYFITKRINRRHPIIIIKFYIDNRNNIFSLFSFWMTLIDSFYKSFFLSSFLYVILPIFHQDVPSITLLAKKYLFKNILLFYSKNNVMFFLIATRALS